MPTATAHSPYAIPSTQNARVFYQSAANEARAPRGHHDITAHTNHTPKTYGLAATNQTNLPARDIASRYMRARTSYSSLANAAAIRSRGAANSNRQAGVVTRGVRTSASHAQVASTIPKTKSGVAKTIAGKLKAGSAAVSTVWPGLFAHGVLLVFWMLSMIGLALADLGDSLLGWVPFLGEWAARPGEILFGFGWIGTLIIGLGTLFVIVGWLFVRGVWWFRDSLVFICLMLTVALYMTPVANVLPWFLLFLAAVVWRS